MTANFRRVGVLTTCLVFASFACVVQAWADDQEDASATPDTELELDRAKLDSTALLDYFLKNSAIEEAHAKFWADELVYTSSNGTRFGKEDIMQGFADAEDAADDAGAGDAPDVVFTGEDVNIQVFGTTAVVTFRLVGTPDDGSEPLQYFNSGTFLKRQGRWQAVNWQATIIPPAGS